jgi:cation transport ATPase
MQHKCNYVVFIRAARRSNLDRGKTMRTLSLSSALGATLAFALIYTHVFFFSGFGAGSWSGWYGFLFKTLVVSALVTVICMVAYGLEILLFMIISVQHKKRAEIIFYLFVGMITGASLSLFYLPYDEFVYFLITATVLTTVGSILFYLVKTFVDSAVVKKILSFFPIAMIFLLYVLVK